MVGIPAVTSQPIVVNPSPDEQWAAYRADAIARDIEQRVAEGRPRHPQYDQLVAEAKMYGAKLVAARVWTAEQLTALEARLV